MEHKDMMECGGSFLLCNNCETITVATFDSCHKCKQYINKKEYKQETTLDKYDFCIKALMNFGIDVLEDLHSHIEISIKNKDEDKSGEVWQIYKKNDTYEYIHLEEGSPGFFLKELEKFIIRPLIFKPSLSSEREYKVELVYGPNIIYLHE